jgi:iron(III) transport system substrate-binding protein
MKPSRRRPRSASVLVLALALLAPVVLAGCSAGSPGGTVTVYSGRTEELIRPLLERFSAETGISVDFKAGDSADLALLIADEGDRSPADVFISQSPGAMAFLDQRGALGSIPQASLDRVGADARSPAGHWVGLSGRVRTLVYNRDQVPADQLPASVFDLTGPAYRDKVALAPTNASFQDFVTAMRADRGDAATQTWLDAMAANGAKAYANNLAIVQAVGRGEVPMGLVNHYYNVEQKRETPALPSENHVFPDGDLGSLLLVAGAAITRTTQHRPEAERLVQFLLSDESQRYFADQTAEYPLATGVPAPSDLPPLDTLRTDTVDFTALGGGLEQTLAMIRQSGLVR